KLRNVVQMATAPMAHIAGVTGEMNNVLAGRKICLMEKFNVAAVTDALVRHRPKVANAPPLAIRMLVDADVPKDVFSTSVALSNGQEGLREIRAPNIGDGKTWVRTTDISVVDEDRFLWIKGRADNAIIRGGFKIMPDDVSHALEQHPAIREAGVTALPDRRLGQ